jgi:hypothetical protein
VFEVPNNSEAILFVVAASRAVPTLDYITLKIVASVGDSREDDEVQGTVLLPQVLIEEALKHLQDASLGVVLKAINIVFGETVVTYNAALGHFYLNLQPATHSALL